MSIRERLAEIDDDMLFADGFDEAIIGWTDSWSGTSHPVRVVYDAKKVIAILELQGLTREEAEEYFDFNIEGAYVGDHTPIFVWLPEGE